jgi:hypothetical protein
MESDGGPLSQPEDDLVMVARALIDASTVAEEAPFLTYVPTLAVRALRGVLDRLTEGRDYYTEREFDDLLRAVALPESIAVDEPVDALDRQATAERAVAHWRRSA